MRVTLAAMAVFLFLSGTAMAAANPAATCESGQLKIAGKYSGCRLKASAKAVARGEAADYTKCFVKFNDTWPGPELKAGPGVCSSEHDNAEMEALISTYEARLRVKVEGWTCPIDFYEDGECDCGCGLPDSPNDCADALATSCDFCNDFGSCNTGSCPGTIDPANNAQCTP